MSEFIHERLDGEEIATRANASPKTHWNRVGRIMPDPLHLDIRQLVRRPGDSGDGVLIEPVVAQGGWGESSGNGCAGDASREDRWIPVTADRSSNPIQKCRGRNIVLNI